MLLLVINEGSGEPFANWINIFVVGVQSELIFPERLKPS